MENVPYNYFSTLLRLYILNLKVPKRRLSAKVRLASSGLLPPNNRLNTLSPRPPSPSSVSPAQISFKVWCCLAGHIILGMANPEEVAVDAPPRCALLLAVLYGRWGGWCPRVGLWWALPIGTTTCTSR